MRFVGCKTGVLLTLGTGLGGGIILNGKMFNGGMNHGVELGHAYLVDGGEPCTCGNHGCMEAYCAASALTREGRRAMQAHPGEHAGRKDRQRPGKDYAQACHRLRQGRRPCCDGCFRSTILSI